MPILSAIGSPSAAGATAPSIWGLTSVSVAPSIAVAPDPPLEVGSFVPLSDINDEPTIELTYDRLSDFSRLDDCVRDSQVLQSVASGHQGLLPRRGMPF